MGDDDGEDYVPVISQFIKRFREQPPTAPSNREHKDDDKIKKSRDAFWWIPPSSSLSGLRGGEPTETIEENDIQAISKSKNRSSNDTTSSNSSASFETVSNHENDESGTVPDDGYEIEESEHNHEEREIDLDNYANELLAKCESLLLDYKEGDDDRKVKAKEPRAGSSVARDTSSSSLSKAASSNVFKPDKDSVFEQYRDIRSGLKTDDIDQYASVDSEMVARILRVAEEEGNEDENTLTKPKYDHNSVPDPIYSTGRREGDRRSSSKRHDPERQKLESSVLSSFGTNASEDTSIFLHLSSSVSSMLTTSAELVLHPSTPSTPSTTPPPSPSSSSISPLPYLQAKEVPAVAATSFIPHTKSNQSGESTYVSGDDSDGDDSGGGGGGDGDGDGIFRSKGSVMTGALSGISQKRAPTEVTEGHEARGEAGAEETEGDEQGTVDVDQDYVSSYLQDDIVRHLWAKLCHIRKQMNDMSGD